MKKTLRKCFMPAFMMLLMLLAATPAWAKNGHSTGSNSHAWIQLLIGTLGVDIWPQQVSNPVPVKGFSYDEGSNTLTINDVQMANFGLITNEMGDDFKIKVTGNNSLGGIVVYGYGWGGNLEIIGNGTLELNKNKIMKTTIVMEAEGTEGRITIGPDVTLTAYKGTEYMIAISQSTKSPAPVIVRGNLETPLALSEKESGKTTLYGWEYLGFETEPTVYNWLYTNDVIRVNANKEPAPSTPGTVQSCTVTFKANGGNPPSKSSVKVASGKAIGTLPTVGRKNYTFKGWYTKKSGGTKVTASTKITKNQTVYAQWTKVSVKQVSAPTVKKAASEKMSVKIKKVSGAKGYQITYSTSSKFKDSKNAATTSLNKTIGKLKKGKTYYVKVRAYKFDSLKNKVYGKYSKTVKVKL